MYSGFGPTDIGGTGMRAGAWCGAKVQLAGKRYKMALVRATTYTQPIVSLYCKFMSLYPGLGTSLQPHSHGSLGPKSIYKLTLAHPTHLSPEDGGSMLLKVLL